jgi:peptidoglycan hydrolase CwlO-like protein
MSVTTSVFLIVSLLIVSGIIGYLTAWLYAKSVYTPVIKKLEDEKLQLNREIDKQKAEISNLKSIISDLNKKVDELDKEVSEMEREISKKSDIIRKLEQPE